MATGLETQISRSRYAAYRPDVCGERVVWADARISEGNTSNDVVVNGKSGAADIYLYDLKTGRETQLVGSQTEGEYEGTVFRQVWMDPVIKGEHVVYTDARQVGPIVYAMQLTDEGGGGSEQ